MISKCVEGTYTCPGCDREIEFRLWWDGKTFHSQGMCLPTDQAKAIELYRRNYPSLCNTCWRVGIGTPELEEETEEVPAPKIFMPDDL